MPLDGRERSVRPGAWGVRESRRHAAEEKPTTVQLAKALRLPLDRAAQEHAVGAGRRGHELDAERGGRTFEAFPRRSCERPGGGQDGEACRSEPGGRLRERHEVAARRRRDGDDARQLLDVVRRCAVVPDHPATAGARDGPRGVTSVWPENRVAALLDEPVVDPGRELRVALVVQNDDPAAGVARPELEPGPRRPALQGISTGGRNGCAERLARLSGPSRRRVWARPGR